LQLAAAAYALLAVWIDHGDLLHRYTLLGALVLDGLQAYLLRYHAEFYTNHRSVILTILHYTRLVRHWQGAKANPQATLLHLKAPKTASSLSFFVLLCKVLFSSGFLQYLPLIYSPIHFYSHVLLHTLTFYHLITAAAGPLVCALTRDGLAAPGSNTYHLIRFLALPTTPLLPTEARTAALGTTTTSTCSSNFSSSSSSSSSLGAHSSPFSPQTCRFPLSLEPLILLVLLLQFLLGFSLPLFLSYMLEWQRKVSYLLPHLPAITTALQQPQQQANLLVAAAAAASHQKVAQLVTELRGCSSQHQVLTLLSSRGITDREQKMLLLMLEQQQRQQQQPQGTPGLYLSHNHKHHHQQQQQQLVGDPDHCYHHPHKENEAQKQPQQQQQELPQQQQQHGVRKEDIAQQSQHQPCPPTPPAEVIYSPEAADPLPLHWRVALSLFGYQGGVLQAVLLQLLLLCGVAVAGLVLLEGPLGRWCQLVVQQQLQEDWQGCS
jgi:hypothetical protein